jgi:hypothetical protein
MSDRRNAAQVQLRKGEVVEVIGEQTLDGQTWYKIAPPAGEFRWIHSRYVNRADKPAPEESPAPAVVTVPIAEELRQHDAAPIALVADAQPASDETWRAAPPSTIAAAEVEPRAATTSIGDIAASNPVANGPLDSASAKATINPAPAAADASSPQPVGSVSEGVASQLTELEMQLSRTVAEPPTTWQIEPLQREVERLLGQAQSAADRAAVQTTLAKINRFDSIGRRYRQVGPIGSGWADPLITATAGSGDPRTAGAAPPAQAAITPLTEATPQFVGLDGQRYDAIGILRPVVSKRPGAPQFALLNERGQVVSFVTPAPDVNLQAFVGKRIGVAGTRGYIPEFQRSHVTAGRVAPLGERIVR